MKKTLLLIAAGGIAGIVNGLLGAGGGMLLVPLLTLCSIDEEQIFPSSVVIILPICIISLLISPGLTRLPWNEAWPFLLAAVPGSILAAFLHKKIPVKWLHRVLGVLILFAGVRYLW